MTKNKVEVYREKGINLVVSQYMVEPDHLLEAIDVLTGTLAKLIEEETNH